MPATFIQTVKGKVLGGEGAPYSDIKSAVDTKLCEDGRVDWRHFWDALIASSFGVAEGDHSLRRLNEHLKAKNRKIVFVFDGLEDLFPDMSQEKQQQAVEALIELPNRIDELIGDRFIGVVVFIREDYVKAVVQQNVGQLEQRFRPYALKWNSDSFLRLAFSLASQAGVFEQTSDDDPTTLGVEELKQRLEILWGKKLGKADSKEAYSARWVYSALCDLTGGLQARDLVRFLKFSAQAVLASQRWNDRVLSPTAMKNAIPQCSEKKVEEACQEIVPLKNWVDILEKGDRRQNQLSVPFSQKAAGLDAQLLKELVNLGVIYEDKDGRLGEDCLFVPEIYRTGLGFELSKKGRPKIQALLKKSLGSMLL